MSAQPFISGGTGAAKDGGGLIQHPDHGAGGFTSTLVPEYVRQLRPAATPTRAILPFASTALCSVGAGLLDATLPPQLAHAGVPASEWGRFVDRLHHSVQPLASPAVLLTMSLIPHTALLFAPFVCVRSSRYHAALAAWLADLNERVLHPHGLHGAFQSNVERELCFSNGAVSWLAVALNREEAARLKREPLLWTPVAVCSCTGDGSLQPHPCPLCVGTGYCGVPCAV